MINDAYNKGRAAALARFKLSSLIQGAAGNNSSMTGQVPANPSPTATTPPAHPAAPLATGARKANVLG